MTFYALATEAQASQALHSGLKSAFQDRLFCRASSWPQPRTPGMVEISVQVTGTNWEHYRCYPTDLPQGAYYRIPLSALEHSAVSVHGG